RIAGLVHGSAERLADDIIGSTRWITCSAELSIARHMCNHQPGISRKRGPVIETPARVRSRLRALHPDVARGQKPQENLAAPGLGEVERDAQHVAPLLHPIRRYRTRGIIAIEAYSKLAPTNVAGSRTFDLNDSGAHFRRQFAGKRLSDQGA